jgi:hypothetical protein
MAEDKTGIFLIVEFDWPAPFEKEHARLARELHQAVQDQEWIKENMAASGGIGGGRSSLWIFWLENYAGLDRLLHDREDPVSQAYRTFIAQMSSVKDTIREEVVFQ